MTAKKSTHHKTYSTPLAQKLGIREGTRLCLIHPPDNYFDLVGELPALTVLCTQPKGCDLVHLFCNERKVLEQQVNRARRAMLKNAGLWISWYKKSSKLPTEINEVIIREIVLPMGLVDVKVCAVDEHWSALKVVWRLEHR